MTLIGNVAPDGSASFYDVIMRVADKRNTPHYPMPVPVISDRPAERALFHSLRPVQAVTQPALAADVTFVGVGQMSDDAPLLKDKFVSPAQHEIRTSRSSLPVGLSSLVPAKTDRQGRMSAPGPDQVKRKLPDTNGP